MKPKKITEEDPIAYVLNYNGEYLYGMYITASYQKFTTVIIIIFLKILLILIFKMVF